MRATYRQPPSRVRGPRRGRNEFTTHTTWSRPPPSSSSPIRGSAMAARGALEPPDDCCEPHRTVSPRHVPRRMT
eukprot:308916-Prymnesium_polylepis.1